MAWMASVRTASARATIACDYLLTQGADLCKLCLYLLGYFLGFLLGVCDGGFLGLDEFFGGADLFFEFRQFFL